MSSRPQSKITISIFFALLAIRIVNSYSVKTFFQPDEYFQSLEPAWQWAFGPQSGAWITWEWREQLRSSLHPLLFASGYRAADQFATLLRLDSRGRMDLLVATPRLMQAVFAATTDLHTYSLAKRIYGSASQSSLAALALTVLSPWHWFCSVRTLSNSLETSLTVMALALFPWDWIQGPKTVRGASDGRGMLNISLVCAGVACILRPTNVLVWLAIIACILTSRGVSNEVRICMAQATLCGSAVLIVSISMDRTFYGFWTFPPLRFLYFNVLQSLAGFYGVNRPDYYFTEGLPLLLTTALPFAIVGLYEGILPESTSARHNEQNDRFIRLALSTAVATSVLALSLISHKEVRFIYPLLPILHVLAAKPMAGFFAPFPVPSTKIKLCMLSLGLAVNLGIAGYVSLVHQRGVVDVINHLRDQQGLRELAIAHEKVAAATTTSISVGFLMPCHSTPWRAYLGYQGTEAWALTCEPPINKTLSERETYMDEADIFYADPKAWIKANMEPVAAISTERSSSTHQPQSQRAWPDFLVFFEQLLPDMLSSLSGTRYRECQRFFNSHWHDDWRRKGDVIVWCLRRKEGVSEVY